MNNNVCQFYIVIGDKFFNSPVDDNVYINATDVTDFKIIQDEIFRLYREKAKLGIRVGSEIIFLVGSISDSEKANEIIKNLRLNGKIEVISKNDILEEVKKDNNIEVDSKIDVIDSKNDIIEDYSVINKQPDNVYKREFDNNYNGYIGSPIEKHDKFGKIPVIIFIISLLLFVVSIVLLFVL